MSPRAAPVRILLVEDNPGDVRLAREMFRETGMAVEIEVATDGEEALDRLHARGAHAGARRPQLVILDLNLPRRSGREVLAEVKADPRLRGIPIVIFTTSAAPDDVRSAYDAHANCYVTKPLDLDDYAKAIALIADFWLHGALLPGGEAAG